MEATAGGLRRIAVTLICEYQKLNFVFIEIVGLEDSFGYVYVLHFFVVSLEQ